ncbi:MAG: NYN domain-containing protein [Candidatus Poribacteria bacterium]|nr:NYN domain-containing protein [Candidatus Poribacteria bacterium]
MHEGQQEQRTLAVFIDFENLALGFDDKKKGRKPNNGHFDIQKVLGRLVEKGKVVVKTAYADWHRFFKEREALHEAGIELIEIPRRGKSGKNSADIRLCVDAIDLCYSKEHIDTFVIISGDSDFAPLVSKLKENGKAVIGLGLKESTSDLLSENCDEFIYYEDLEEELEKDVTTDQKAEASLPKELREIFDLLFSSIRAIIRENHEILWSSMVKDTMKRKRPSFSESLYGYKSFSELLEDAQRRGFIKLEKNPRSGTYVVVGFTDRMK